MGLEAVIVTFRERRRPLSWGVDRGPDDRQLMTGLTGRIAGD